MFGFITVSIEPSQIVASAGADKAYRVITREDGSEITNQDNTRVKIGLSLLTANRFARVKKGERVQTSIIDVVVWVSRSVLPLLVPGKHVSGIGSIERYQGRARGAQLLATTPDLEEARQLRDEHQAQYPEAGLVSITTEDGHKLYQIYSKVVDRMYIELDRLDLAQDAYVDHTETIANLEKQLADLQAYASEHSGQGLSQEALAKVSETLANAKATRADMREALEAVATV